tara:strand:+ start:6588 stop:9041 length:2454 start_codon:yes stop_codon:yes gene_type:complete
MKLLIENWRKFLKEQKIQEATEEEIENLKQLLEMPAGALPFNDFFQGKYRIAQAVDLNVGSGPLGKILTFLEKYGWEFFVSEDGDKNTLKARKTKETVYKKDGKSKISRKSIELNLPKLFSQFVKTPETYKQIKYRTSRAKVAYAGQTAVLSKLERNLQKIGQQLNFLYGPEGAARITNRGNPDLKTAKELKEFVDDGNKLDDLTRNYKNYTSKNYLIYSRHPIDVYRMSDFRPLESCHSLPSSDYKKAEGGDGVTFDKFNICALSEAHGNGVISYVVPEESMREFLDFGEDDGEITIEDVRRGLDAHEVPEAIEGEIFEDPQRNLGGLSPITRLRIKNVSYNNGDQTVKLLAPQGKTYGVKFPGLAEYVYKSVAESQSDKMRRVIELEGGEIDMGRFTRYGGSYQDEGYQVSKTLPKLFKAMSNQELIFFGEPQYDSDMQNELMGQLGVPNVESVRQRIVEVIQELGLQSNIKLDFDLVEDDGQFSVDFICDINIWVHSPRDASLTFAETNAVQDEIENRVADLLDVYLADIPGSAEGTGNISRVAVRYEETGSLKGFDVNIRLDSDCIQYFSYEPRFDVINGDLQDDLTTVFDGFRQRGFPGLSRIFDRLGPVYHIIIRSLQEQNLIAGGEARVMGSIGQNFDGTGDFDFEFDLYDDDGEESSDGYSASGQYNYEIDSEEIKIAKLLAKSVTDSGLMERTLESIYNAMGSHSALNILEDKMNFKIEPQGQQTATGLGMNYEAMPVKLSWSVETSDIGDGNKIRTHMASMENVDWEDINESLMELADEVIGDEPEPEETEQVNENIRFIKLRVLRG